MYFFIFIIFLLNILQTQQYVNKDNFYNKNQIIKLIVNNKTDVISYYNLNSFKHLFNNLVKNYHKANRHKVFEYDEIQNNKVDSENTDPVKGCVKSLLLVFSIRNFVKNYSNI